MYILCDCSRFDIVLVLTDTPSESRDQQVARHILNGRGQEPPEPCNNYHWNGGGEDDGSNYASARLPKMKNASESGVNGWTMGVLKVRCDFLDLYCYHHLQDRVSYVSQCCIKIYNI